MGYATLSYRSKTSFVLGAALVLTLAALLILTRQSYALSAPTERYIVVLKDSVRDSRSVASEHSRSHQAEVNYVYSNALKGYAAKIPAGRLQAIERDPRVAYVEPDGIATTTTTQTNATWGLDRIDQASLPLNGEYTYTSAGSNVTSYIIDTGIRKSHTDFGSRVTDGFDAVDGALPADDCNGHGTHVAGTAGGSQYGVAKNTTIVAVRVLDCAGSGYWSWIIAGIDYVTAAHIPGTSAVANMSLGGGANASADTAIKNSIAKGVTYVVAAGNSSADACKYSPARVAEAITVGATDKTDTKASFSNWGSCIDLFAPGVGITSTWFNSDTDTNTLNGTSMASPHAAGVAAQYLELNPAASPNDVRNALYAQTTKDIVKRSRSINDHLLLTKY